ncbi:thrombospondin [Verrucosispora sp. ts21]|uniref:DUF4383 domain-containing protein n=1 Tax=Verrucosispora sp. ts21 TaxID=2069341 RepID=UPI000C87F59F|nr:DUF4383 domain-containing protein [Verrucosispora sp. ts21]PMR58589.1 thrombospondin [Verrucosispora sp. ts21]
MRFPSLSRRTEPATTLDEDAERGATVATDTRPTDRNDETYRTSSAAPTAERPTNPATAERPADTAATRAANPAAADRSGTAERASDRAATGGGAGAAPVDSTDRPATERAAARAATARSGVDGSRRARATTPVPPTGRTTPTSTTTRNDTAATPTSTTTPTEATTRNGVTTTGVIAGSSVTDRTRTDDLERAPERDPALGGERDGSVERTDGREASDEAQVVAGRRPRPSLLATVGLIVGVAGLLFVLTGTLAGYGIGIGALGAVFAVLGLIATRRRNVAGKPDALLGIAFGLGAVVLGVLAMTGQYEWPNTDGDTVARLREWLDSQFVDRF